MGRPFKFKEPKEVWTLYQNYLEHLKQNPLYRNELIKSGDRAGEVISVEVPVPPNIYGFCLFAGIERKTYYNYINGQVNGKEGDNFDPNLIHIFTCVDDDIKQKQLTGATVNLYNGNIVARITGLSDQVNVNHTGERQAININIDGNKLDLTR